MRSWQNSPLAISRWRSCATEPAVDVNTVSTAAHESVAAIRRAMNNRQTEYAGAIAIDLLREQVLGFSPLKIWLNDTAQNTSGAGYVAAAAADPAKRIFQLDLCDRRKDDWMITRARRWKVENQSNWLWSSSVRRP